MKDAGKRSALVVANICLATFLACSFLAPDALAISPDLLVASSGTAQILRYDRLTGAFVGAFVPAGSGGLGQPDGLVFGPDGNLYVGSDLTDEILRYDGQTGAFLGAFVPAGSGGLEGPAGLSFGPDGNLYVSSLASDEVLRYSGQTGTFLGAFVPAGGGGLDAPLGLVFGPDGNLYVGSLFTREVLRYDGQTGAFLGAFVPAGSGGLSAPRGLAFGPDGHLYVSSVFGPIGGFPNQVLRYDGQTGAFINDFVVQGSGGLTVPGFLTFFPVAVFGCIEVQGEPLTGATIELKQRGSRTTTTTDVRGCYAFQNLGPRRGTITIDVP